MDGDINRIDIKEFREFGYLQEVNRRFLHPLGLALEVVLEKDGTESLGGVWDYRESPNGIHYVKLDLFPKAYRVDKEWESRVDARTQELGYMIQGVE